MRRVTRQRHARGNEPFGQRQRQGVGEPRACQCDLAKEIAEARAQGGQIARIVQRLNCLCRRVRLAPHDRGVVSAGQGQNGQRPCRHEELMRSAFVILLVMNGRDKRGLAIAPALPPDPGPRRHPRPAPVAADQKPPRNAASRGQGDRHALGSNLLCQNSFARQQRDLRLCPHRVEESRI